MDRISAIEDARQAVLSLISQQELAIAACNLHNEPVDDGMQEYLEELELIEDILWHRI